MTVEDDDGSIPAMICNDCGERLCVGTKVPCKLSGFRCAGSVTREFSDAVIWQDFMDGEPADMDLRLSRGVDSIILTIKRACLLKSGSSTG